MKYLVILCALSGCAEFENMNTQQMEVLMQLSNSWSSQPQRVQANTRDQNCTVQPVYSMSGGVKHYRVVCE
jgi:hypothetical protein